MSCWLLKLLHAEDVVEINTHGGGIAVTNEILQLVLRGRKNGRAG